MCQLSVQFKWASLRLRTVMNFFYSPMSFVRTGSFGRVMLAKNKRTGEFYAMKRLKKSDIIKLRQVDHVISENTILADIDHPFLVSYIKKRARAGHISHSYHHVYNKINTLVICLGRTARVHTGLSLPVLPHAVHSRRWALHLPSHWGKTQPRTCNVSVKISLWVAHSDDHIIPKKWSRIAVSDVSVFRREMKFNHSSFLNDKTRSFLLVSYK